MKSGTDKEGTREGFEELMTDGTETNNDGEMYVDILDMSWRCRQKKSNKTCSKPRKAKEGRVTNGKFGD